MLSTQHIADQLVAWAVDLLPDIQGTYSTPVASKKHPLPDVSVEVQGNRVQRTPEEFREYSVEQIPFLRVHRFNMTILVPAEPIPEWGPKLLGYVDTLQARAGWDAHIGDRLPTASLSPETSTTMTPPFVEFEDRTRGRQATLALVVGEPVDPEA